MSRRSLPIPVTLALASIALAPVAAEANSPSHGSAADREALLALDQAYVEAWKLQGSEAQEAALRPLFADDVLVMPGRGSEPKPGWQAIRDFWFPEGSPPTNVRAFEHHILRVDLDGDLGAVAGRSRLDFEYAGREVTQGGSYLIVARRNPAGEWKIVQMIWTDRPVE